MLNREKVIEKKEELTKYKGYLPLLLHNYIHSLTYFENNSDNVAKEYYKKRTQLQGADNPSEFLKEDLLNWIKKNPEYKELLD